MSGLDELLNELELAAHNFHRWPQADQLALLRVVRAAERRRQAYAEWDGLYHNRWKRSEGEFCRKCDRLFAAFREAMHAEDAALAALEKHLTGDAS